ncbi:MAG: hypothetical protein JO250_01820, partial [Armatimonadetes bacterium]|nr:hypothetical protein [Armatimonadota bacterium]
MANGQVANEPPVRYRPDQSNWVVVLLFGIFGLAPTLCFWLTPSRPADRVMMSLLGAGFVIPALLLAIWLLRAQIIATEDGLRWRGLGGWRFAGWAQVTDYYDKLLPKKGLTAIIETGGRKLQISQSFWKDNPEFRALVVQNATQARAGGWGVWGTRPELDWPRVFGYKSRDNWSIAFVFRFLWVLALILAATLIPKIVNTFTTLGWKWGLASIGALLLGLGPMFLYLSLFQTTSADMRRRWKQRITISAGGLTYEGDGTKFQVPWDEIMDYSIAPRRGFNLASTYAVVTKRGSFDFSGAISEVGILTRLIADNATAAGAETWRSQGDDVLGGKASRWTSGCEGVGERVYHYRTRTNRALLWFLSFFSALIPVSVVIHKWVGMGAKDDPVFVAIMTTLMGGSTLWAIWRYYTASIQTDGVGITQHTIWGRRFLCWDQIERYYKSGGDAAVFGNVVGAGTRIRFWMEIADVEELKDEITR